MDGAHDLGGKEGFGAVTPELQDPAFHEQWEAMTWAMFVLAIGKLRAHTPDAYRHSVERMNAAWYLTARYYERMLTGTATLLVERAVVPIEELERRAGGGFPLSEPVASPLVAQVEDSVAAEAQFAPGDSVFVSAVATPGHTRCPAYLRGRRGVVRRVYPLAYYPELRAHSRVKRREHSYAVEFAATDLWIDGDPRQCVSAELFESYLSPR